MKSVCLSHPGLRSDCSNLVRRNRFEGKGLHEGQEDGLGRFSLDRSLTLIDTCNLEILCKGARHVFLQDVRDTHRLLPVSGKVIKTLTTRTHALTLGARQTRCSRNLSSWEPFKSFKNCGEEIIERFWDRVDTKGRDVNSIEGWTNGEEIYPIGPPRTPSHPKHNPRNLLF